MIALDLVFAHLTVAKHYRRHVISTKRAFETHGSGGCSSTALLALREAGRRSARTQCDRLRQPRQERAERRRITFRVGRLAYGPDSSIMIGRPKDAVFPFQFQYHTFYAKADKEDFEILNEEIDALLRRFRIPRAQFDNQPT